MKLRGFTIVEWLIAACLSLVLLGCVTTYYLSYKRNHDLAQSLIDVQNHGRIATHLLQQAIESAGQITCPLAYQHNPNWINIFNSIKKQSDAEPSVVIYPSTDPKLPHTIAKNIKPNTDALSVRYFRLMHCDKANLQERSEDIYYISKSQQLMMNHITRGVDWEEALIENIESLKIENLTAQKPNTLFHVNVLTVSSEKTIERPYEYRFDKKTWLVEDGYLRKPWEITVGVQSKK